MRAYISIHALLAESDLPTDGLFYFSWRFLSTLSLRRATRPCQVLIIVIDNFYPRSPCGERPIVPVELTTLVKFLSTLSLRRATISARRGASESIDFYPRSPCGERPRNWQKPHGQKKFLSTLSLRRATRYGRPIDVQLVFLSTLSLR